MKNHKQWKHKKEFDTKTLFEDIRKDEKILNENSESSVGKSDISNEENSERFCVQSPSDTIPKNTRIHISSEEKNVSGNGGHPAKKTKVYEPRPLTPDDEIYEDILEHFASAPTKPKYWFEEFGDYWSCSCGHINKGNSCKNCGLDRELLRSLFILHKPADTPGKLNKKLRKAKEQVDREETLEAERKRRRQKLDALQGDHPHVVPIEEDPATDIMTDTVSPSPELNETKPAESDPAAGSKEKRAPEIHTYSPQGKDDDPEEKNEAANTDQKSDEGLSPDQTKDPLQHDADKGSPEHPQANGQASDPSSDTALVPVSSEVQKKEKKFSSWKKPSFRTKMIILIACLLLLATGGGIAVYKYLAAPAIQYEEAIKLQNSGKYEKAIDKFESLGDYRDSKEHIWECYISIGDRYYKNGEYEQAIKTYNTAMKLKESDRIQTKIRKCYIGIGDRYYENNEFENAIASYQTAMEMKDTDALQEKINKAKFGYVKAYQSKRTDQVETYLAELMSIKYPGIQEIYDTYYAWHVKIIANTAEDDYSNDMDTISRHDTAYFHATLSGGEPSEEIELYYEIVWPNGAKQVYNLDSKWKSGSKITARFQYPIPLFGSEGKLTFTLYDKSTNEAMGNDSITFQN